MDGCWLCCVEMWHFDRSIMHDTTNRKLTDCRQATLTVSSMSGVSVLVVNRQSSVMWSNIILDLLTLLP